MAALWNVIRQEVQASVDELREKGVVGAFKDAALDVVDLAKSGGELIVDGVQSLVGDEWQPVLRADGMPAQGATVTLDLGGDRAVQALVVGVDGISDPPCAKVIIVGEENMEPITVEVRPLDWVRPQAAGGAEGLLDSIKEEVNLTINDFREKGAVGAMRDATLDAVDLVHSSATAVGSGAYSAAGAVGAQGILDSIQEEVDLTVTEFREKGAVGAMRDATIDAVGVVQSSASAVGNGAMTLAAPLADLIDLTDTPGEGDAAIPADLGLLGGLKTEVRNTVQDFREKGAIGTLKDATLDAADMVSEVAATAAGGARYLGGHVYDGATVAAGSARTLGGSLLDMVPSAPADAAAPAVAATAASGVPSTPPARTGPRSPGGAAGSRPVVPKLGGFPGAGAAPAQEFRMDTGMTPRQGPQVFGMATPRPVQSSGAGKSIVQMRREAFEKQQQEQMGEQEKEPEEVID